MIFFFKKKGRESGLGSGWLLYSQGTLVVSPGDLFVVMLGWLPWWRNVFSTDKPWPAVRAGELESDNASPRTFHHAE
jgi:hypothetical protein